MVTRSQRKNDKRLFNTRMDIFRQIEFFYEAAKQCKKKWLPDYKEKFVSQYNVYQHRIEQYQLIDHCLTIGEAIGNLQRVLNTDKTQSPAERKVLKNSIKTANRYMSEIQTRIAQKYVIIERVEGWVRDAENKSE